MASPTLLFERTRQAIESNDVVAFDRWTKHPRWRRSPEWDEAWAHAALRAACCTEWLQRMEGLGVSLLSGYRQPLLCEAARTNNTAAMEWLLNKGADVETVSDYGLGATAGYYALKAGATEALELMWKKTGRVWSLVGPSRFSAWVRPESLPVLEHMARCGWSPDDLEVSRSNPDGQSFRQRLADQDAPAPPSLCAWLESSRLDGALARPGQTPASASNQSAKPRARL